jgi:hypothetical protein
MTCFLATAARTYIAQKLEGAKNSLGSVVEELSLYCAKVRADGIYPDTILPEVRGIYKDLGVCVPGRLNLDPGKNGGGALAKKAL